MKPLSAAPFPAAAPTLVAILLFLLTSCGRPHPWYNHSYDQHQLQCLQPSRTPLKTDSEQSPTQSLPTAPGTFTLFMIGDCGKTPAGKNWPPLTELKNQLATAGPNSAVIFLGDNIYEYGLTAETSPDRKEMERRMIDQLDATKGFKGKVIVIPGNHDWAQGKPEGYQVRLREEKFVESYLHQGNTFLPDNGCPGPFELPLNERITLLAYDSQWWLHKHQKPGKKEGCNTDTDAEFIAEFRNALERNKDKQIIIAAHHPLHSYGAHGGHYHPKFHLFPLLMANHNLWIPLPVLGSIGVWYRQVFGNIQDIPHHRYQALKKELEALFSAYPNLIYISGHDHNLQYLPIEDRHYIVSGSGCKSTYCGHGKRAQFTDAETGFGRLIFDQGGKERLEFYATDSSKTTLRFTQEW